MTESVASGQLRAFIERIERLSEEAKTIADDIRDVKYEAKSMGFSVKAINEILKLRKLDDQQRNEEEIILDTYKAALGMIPDFERDVEPEVEPVNPRLIQQVVTGMQTETGRAALIAAVDILIEREEAEEQNQPETADEMDRATEGSFETGSEAAEKGRKATATVAAPVDLSHAGASEILAEGDRGTSIVLTNSEIAPASQGEAEAPSVESVSPETHGSSDANTGGSHVDASISAATHQAGGLVKAPPATFVLRPNCLKPEACGGYGVKHCHSCTIAANERELA